MNFTINNNVLTITRVVKNSLSHFISVNSGITFVPIKDSWYIADSKTNLCFYLGNFFAIDKIYDLLAILEELIPVNESAMIVGVPFEQLIKEG